MMYKSQMKKAFFQSSSDITKIKSKLIADRIMVDLQTMSEESIDYVETKLKQIINHSV